MLELLLIVNRLVSSKTKTVVTLQIPLDFKIPTQLQIHIQPRMALHLLNYSSLNLASVFFSKAIGPFLCSDHQGHWQRLSENQLCV